MADFVRLQDKREKTNPIKTYIFKMKGGGHAPSRTNFADAITGAIGGLICIFVLLWLTNYTGAPWLMASLGGSCVLVFVVWNAPLSQPRNIIGGHLISAFIGLIMYSLLGTSIVSISLGVGLTIFLMSLLGIIHPPAGANPIIIILGGYGWNYLVMPVLIGALIIVFFGLVINNLRETRKYPLFW
ncbi:HPP family protein [Lysinibacillus sp. NPDC094177]|uniref:HPP family protein n=1 Tax=Lysinibacillus sp. NPDC094177 TaxID=3390580 RepID=UPI003CFC0824